jgi:hypothetical protein
VIVYHGTSKKNYNTILKEGVSSPSYWASNYEQAKEYADSFGSGVVLVCNINDYDFKANMLVAQCLLENDEIEVLPDENDLEHSLEYLEGIVCHDTIYNFEKYMPAKKVTKKIK